MERVSKEKPFIQDNIVGANTGIIPRKVCSTFAVVDLAATTKQTSDWTVIIVFSVTPKKQVLILDVIRERFDGSQHLELLKEVYEHWRPVLIGIESVQYQIALVQSARKSGLPVKELRPDKDKVARSLPMAALMESGDVFFKADAG